MKVNFTDFYLAAPSFQRAGSSIGDAVSGAQSRLAEMGTFWGDDASGQLFGSHYAADQDRLLQLLAIVAGEVSGISDGMSQMAANFGAAEEANVNKIRALEQEMS